jgi:hypothetical protein
MLHRYLRYCHRNLLDYHLDGVGTSKNEAGNPLGERGICIRVDADYMIFIPGAIIVTHIVIVNINIDDGYENVPILQVGPGATIHEASMS